MDESKAVRYYTMAANQGCAGAQFALGECLELGRVSTLFWFIFVHII